MEISSSVKEIPNANHENAVQNAEDSEPLMKLVKDYIEENSGSSCNTNNDISEKLKRDVLNSFELIDGQKSLVHIVECLGFALTDIKVENRAKGTGLLAEFIHLCLPGSMNNPEMHTLMIFFCDRLKDHHSIQPLVIYAFLGLISYQNIKDDLIIAMLQSIFSEVHVQSLVQADRGNVFNIFSNLLKARTDVLKMYGMDFIIGFIQAMDGERDPRNLLICFENSHIVMKELDFSLFVEDLFEVLSCYFPVEFTEPKEDEFRIKKCNLVESLRNCLTCTKLFAQFAIPLYLEKLSSELMDSKIDSLITFTECLKIYNPEDVGLFIDDIWLGIRKDYLLSDYAELSSPYLEFVYQLVKCLSKSENNDSLMKIINFLIKDCLQTFKDPEMAICIPCGNLILHVSNASSAVFEVIINKLIMIIQQALEKYSSTLQRTSMLEIILRIISVANEDIVPNALLIEFVDYLLPQLYTTISNIEEDSKLQILSLKCLEKIISKSTWFENCNYDILAQHCFTPLQQRILIPEVMEGYKTFVGILSKKCPIVFKNHFLEALKNNLIAKVDNKIVSQCLHLLGCKNIDLLEDIHFYFSSFITAIIIDHLDKCQDVLDCYTTVLKNSKVSIITDDKYCLYILQILDLLTKTIDPSNTLLLSISYNLSEMFKNLNTRQRREVYLFVFELLSNQYCINGSLFGVTHILQLNTKLLQFSILLRGVLTQLTAEELNEMDVDSVCNELLKLMQKVDESMILQHLGIVFGSVINKLPRDSPITEKHLHIISDFFELKTHGISMMVLLSWICKALVLNWQKATTIAIDLLMKSLNDEKHGNLAATGFDVIVRDVEGALNKECNACIKLMHRQRFTQYAIPLLIDNYHDGREDMKSFHMIAISNTLPAIPKQMMQSHLKSLTPLLMNVLATRDTISIIESTLSTISSVLAENKDVIMEYVPSLVSRLLYLATHSCMNIRILSLKSLSILSSYTPHIVRPMRNEVIKNVKPLLDDKKRLVRREAVECSNSWHLMSSASD